MVSHYILRSAQTKTPYYLTACVRAMALLMDDSLLFSRGRGLQVPVSINMRFRVLTRRMELC